MCNPLQEVQLQLLLTEYHDEDNFSLQLTQLSIVVINTSCSSDFRISSRTFTLLPRTSSFVGFFFVIRHPIWSKAFSTNLLQSSSLEAHNLRRTCLLTYIIPKLIIYIQNNINVIQSTKKKHTLFLRKPCPSSWSPTLTSIQCMIRGYLFPHVGT